MPFYYYRWCTLLSQYAWIKSNCAFWFSHYHYCYTPVHRYTLTLVWRLWYHNCYFHYCPINIHFHIFSVRNSLKVHKICLVGNSVESLTVSFCFVWTVHFHSLPQSMRIPKISCGEDVEETIFVGICPIRTMFLL